MGISDVQGKKITMVEGDQELFSTLLRFFSVPNVDTRMNDFWNKIMH